MDPPANNLPQWLERPGASEAVVVGADIRSRYGALKAETRTKADEVLLIVHHIDDEVYCKMAFTLPGH